MTTTESNRQINITKKANQQILINKHLIIGLEIMKEILLENEGKVVNKRILQSKEDRYIPHDLTISLDSGSIKISDFTNRSFRNAKDEIQYIDNYYRSFAVAFQDNNRLSATGTINNLNGLIDRLNSENSECQKAIESMDEEYNAWKEIQAKVISYKENFSSKVTGYIDMRR